MIAIASLWLPILLSAVFVFIASSILQMLVGHHWNDARSVPQQQALLDTLRSLALPSGDYMVPRPASRSAMRDPAFMEQLNMGPVARLQVLHGGMQMGKSLLQWFVYVVIVGACCAYIASRELQPGAHYLSVFRLTGFAAFAAYALALPQAAIWYGRSWRMTVMTMIDGLVYAMLTGGVFGWLWPH
jgi:hypothetical protein